MNYHMPEGIIIKQYFDTVLFQLNHLMSRPTLKITILNKRTNEQKFFFWFWKFFALLDDTGGGKKYAIVQNIWNATECTQNSVSSCSTCGYYEWNQLEFELGVFALEVTRSNYSKHFWSIIYAPNKWKSIETIKKIAD